MTVQLSVAVRNARLDAIESTIGVSAKLKIRTGAQPSSCVAADTGTIIATADLPADYMDPAGSGTKAKAGTWEDPTADANGTAGHWRLYATDGTTCGAQGSCTATGGGGDMELDNVSINAGQQVTITAWTFTDGNS